VRRPVRYEKPAVAGDYDHALHVDHPDAPSLLEQYLDKPIEPHIGGQPNVTAAGDPNPLAQPNGSGEDKDAERPSEREKTSTGGTDTASGPTRD